MRFGIDLDRTRFGRPGIQPAAAEFGALFDDTDGYAAYYSAVEAVPLGIPVLRTTSTGVSQLERQLEHITSLDRGLILRLTFGELQNAAGIAAAVLAQSPDAVVIVDAEWSRDLLSRQVWATDLIKQINNVSDAAELVLCGTSFPESFSDIVDEKSFEIQERKLFAEVSKHFNSPIHYGDWGSTRPPKDGGGAGKRRIDLPERSLWAVYREKNVESYKDIATRVVSSESWPSELNIWGTYAISSTAQGLPGAIRGQEAAAAARINIHLHQQAFYGSTDIIGDAEEPFVDI